MEIRSFKNLTVWQEALSLAKEIYALTAIFPKEEVYSLTNQIRRASVSVASNIAEGSIRRSKAEFARFVNMASGSLAELETQLILAERIGYVSFEDVEELMLKIENISKMLFFLHKSLIKPEVA